MTYDGNGSTGGSVPIDSNSYAQGATAIVLGNIGNLSLTKNGYTFTGWNTAADGSGTSYAAGATLTMGVANVTLYAQWTANPPVTYTVSVSANPQAGGMVSGGGTYAEGASVTVTATPNSGYTFINWTEGGIQASTSATYTFPMGTADRTLVAGFAASPPPPSGGGGGGYAPSPISATVTGSVIDSTTGAKISNIPATVTADSHGSDTISMNAAKALLVKQSGGNPSPLSDLSQVAIAGAAGTPVIVSADGTIQVAGLAKGTDNKFDITYDLGNSQKITLGTMEVKIDSSGNATLTTTLIDPYGLVTDEATGKPVAGANITLYYADTERNRAAGKTPDTVAALPIITGFKPDNNQNPQVSDTAGAYSFLAFPNSDYYIVATKVGYEQYTSPTISVEQEIVHWDFKMSPTISGVTRLAGQSRVDTALAIAQAEYTGKIANVILATAGNYPDALTGSVLAYQLQAPILLVGSSDADQEKVLAYMKDNMNPSGTVYILGGTGVVSSAMEAKVTADGFPKITRLGGADRYETSVKIAGQLGVGSGTPIVLVNGENYPDALSISSIAAQMQLPILLVQKDGISDSVSQEIASIKPSKVYIIGGEGAISATVESQVAQLTGLDQGNIMRIGGADRYATSLAVAQYFNLSGQNVCVATGDNFPDALAGSVYAANHNAPIILADDSLSDQVMNYLKGKNLTGATIFGGEAVVSKDIEQQLQQLIGQ
ncbi:cell wall-binding repeat-containing protein [Acididesulfobacillus acetoxydans]|uniref:cell wall-binding repeat-containing protein n=1 Tax=Acididesulfobacillus acetoxydans TaxID=1561005 RepID=UPI003FD89117